DEDVDDHTKGSDDKEGEKTDESDDDDDQNEAEKRRREEDDDQEGPSARLDLGSKRRRDGGEHSI
nr:hypothetical protein [Tanacetum cinerariifolium]